jgi:hypothetical protein
MTSRGGVSHKNQRDSFCRQCRAAYHREHYLTNRRRYIDQAAKQRARLKLERTRYLLEYFRSHPCIDCGEDDPIVLESDHLGDKEFTIGSDFCVRNWDSILAEIKKCEVVCANCHRKRTAQRRGSMRLRLSET